MKAFGAVIIFLILFMAVLVMIAFFYLRKLFLKFQRHITGDYDEETFKRMADKHYKGDGPKFDKDYFKSSGSKKQEPKARSNARSRAAREPRRLKASPSLTSATIKRANKRFLRKTKASMWTSLKRHKQSKREISVV